MPEYPTITYMGQTEDGKYIYLVGNARREVPADDIGFEHFKYTLYRLDRLIRYKREKIALDSIV